MRHSSEVFGDLAMETIPSSRETLCFSGKMIDFYPGINFPAGRMNRPWGRMNHSSGRMICFAGGMVFVTGEMDRFSGEMVGSASKLG